MQQLVLPLPTAPNMEMPVNNPFSGIVSQYGFSDGSGLRGLCTSPTTQKNLFLPGGIWIVREPSGRDAPAGFQRENIEAGERGRISHVGRCKKEHDVEVLEAQERVRGTHGNNLEEDLVFGKGMRIKQVDSRRHGENCGDEAARLKDPSHH